MTQNAYDAKRFRNTRCGGSVGQTEPIWMEGLSNAPGCDCSGEKMTSGILIGILIVLAFFIIAMMIAYWKRLFIFRDVRP